MSGIHRAGIEHADAVPAVMIGGVHMSAGHHWFSDAAKRRLVYSLGILPGRTVYSFTKTAN